jgi:hypothetical protein
MLQMGNFGDLASTGGRVQLLNRKRRRIEKRARLQPDSISNHTSWQVAEKVDIELP